MSGGALAGRLKARVTLSRPTGAVDVLGAGMGWSDLGTVWAELRPQGYGAPFAGEARSSLPLWQVTVRTTDIAVGDRIEWPATRAIVREIRADPDMPDRIVTLAEEER